jgi:hypothetical protein
VVAFSFGGNTTSSSSVGGGSSRGKNTLILHALAIWEDDEHHDEHDEDLHQVYKVEDEDMKMINIFIKMLDYINFLKNIVISLLFIIKDEKINLYVRVIKDKWFKCK